MTMPPIRVNSSRLNQTVHKARIEEPALIALAERAVAEQLGLDVGDLTMKGLVSFRSHTSTYQEGSLGTRKTCVEVEIVVHHPEREIDAPGPA